MKGLVLLPLLGLALPLVVCGKESKDAKDPAEAFQGEWIVVSLGFSGYELKGTAERPMKVIFTKDRIVFRPTFRTRKESSMSFSLAGLKTERSIGFSILEREEEGAFQLNPNKSPAWIDLKESDNKEGSKGIYRLQQDELELCIARFATSKRPDAFKISDSTYLLRLKRKTKKN